MSSVLIVDDSPDTCEALSKYLERAGHQVRCEPNGSQALTAVLTAPPDVVVLDLLMPEMDGPSFVEVVRSYLRFQDLPIIVLTALSEGPVLERTRRAKVNDILQKGKADFDDVLRAIDAATRTHAFGFGEPPLHPPL